MKEFNQVKGKEMLQTMKAYFKDSLVPDIMEIGEEIKAAIPRAINSYKNWSEQHALARFLMVISAVFIFVAVTYGLTGEVAEVLEYLFKAFIIFIAVGLTADLSMKNQQSNKDVPTPETESTNSDETEK